MIQVKGFDAVKGYEIPFTQFLLPRGERRSVHFYTTSKEVYEKASRITDAGYRFEVEVLRTGQVSATITGPKEVDGTVQDMDLAFSITANDGTVVTGIEKMIRDFHLADGSIT